MHKTKSFLESWGAKSLIARRSGICRSTVSEIISGKRRATLRQAALLEEYLVKHGVAVSRWDLLYGLDVENGQSLLEYLNRKEK